MCRTILITGAASGIGKAVVLYLIRDKKVQLIPIVRNPTDVRRLEAYFGSKCVVDIKLCDLASINQVRTLIASLLATYTTIDIIINNAGARFDQYQESEDGIELTFATNHLGHFLLTNQLIQGLEEPPKKVINVSSSAHNGARPELGWISSKKDYDRRIAYANSKLANILFTQELSRRFNPGLMSSYSVDPGPTATGFARNNGLVAWIKHLVWHGLKRELRSAAKGADTITYLATQPIEDSFNGKLFADRKPIEPASRANDAELADQLWELSCTVTNRVFQNKIA